MLLGWQSQPFSLRPCRQDQCVAGVDRTAVADGGERAFGQIQRCDMVADDFGAQSAGMCLHPSHQVRALNFGIAGPVLDLGRYRQLAAGLYTLHQQRVQHGTAGIDASSIARWT